MAKFKKYKDQAKNAFSKTNLFYTSSPFLGTQDPTVFGFKLFFHFDHPGSPLLYGATRDIQSAPVNTAAHFLKSIGDDQRLYYLEKFIYLLSGINSQTPWYFQSLTGLQDAWKQDLKTPLLKDKKLEIECLEAIDLRVTAMMDLYRKACYDWKNRREVVPENLRRFKLSVYVYEARWINNANAIAMSASAASDATQVSYNYNDDPVPYGYGGNIFGEAAKKNAELTSRLTGTDETAGDPSTSDVNITEGTPMSTTRNLFHFDFCTFNMSEPNHLGTISNAEPADVSQKFAINYFDVEEENMYNFWTSTDPISDAYVRTLDKAALDDPNIQGNQPGVPQDSLNRPTVAESFNLFDKVKSAGQAKLDDIAKQAEDKWNTIKERFDPGNVFNDLTDRGIAVGTNAVTSRLNNLFLGNIYGFSGSSLVNAATGGGILGVGQQIGTANILDAGSSIVNAKNNPINQNTSYGGSLTNDSGTPPSGTPGVIGSNVNTDSNSLANDDDPNSFNVSPDNVFE